MNLLLENIKARKRFYARASVPKTGGSTLAITLAPTFYVRRNRQHETQEVVRLRQRLLSILLAILSYCNTY